MLAKAVHSVPRAPGLVFEPKWDGFRCVAFRDGAELELGSRNDQPLTRYFPEVVEVLRAGLPPRCVVDGEIVIVTPEGFRTARGNVSVCDRVRSLVASVLTGRSSVE
jgi:ATP-dependent DNA ligase